MEPFEQAGTAVQGPVLSVAPVPVAQLRDRVIEKHIAEVLNDHRALSGLKLDISVRGGVAHVRGAVSGEDERKRLRGVLSRIRGVHAVWDVLSVGGTMPRILDLGCGNKKQVPEAIGVDGHAFEAVSVVTDLERPLPFSDAGVDQVYAVHLLEHIRDLIGLMNEIHRVLKPSGILHVLVPGAASVNSAADPTHVRFFNPQTFKFFCRRYPGLRPFRPDSISSDRDTVFADLIPVQRGAPLPTDEELAYFFD